MVKKKLVERINKNILSDAFEDVLREIIEIQTGSVIVFLPWYVEDVLLDYSQNENGKGSKTYHLLQTLPNGTLPALDVSSIPVFETGQTDLADVYLIPLVRNDCISLMAFSIYSNSPIEDDPIEPRGDVLEIKHYYTSENSISIAEACWKVFEKLGIFFTVDKRECALEHVKLKLLLDVSDLNNELETREKLSNELLLKGIVFQAALLLSVIRSYLIRDQRKKLESKSRCCSSLGYLDAQELENATSDLETFYKHSEWVKMAIKKGLVSKNMYGKVVRKVLETDDQTTTPFDGEKPLSMLLPPSVFSEEDAYELLMKGKVDSRVLLHYLKTRRWIQDSDVELLILSNTRNLEEKLQTSQEIKPYVEKKKDLLLLFPLENGNWTTCCFRRSYAGVVVYAPSVVFAETNEETELDVICETLKRAVSGLRDLCLKRIPMTSDSPKTFFEISSRRHLSLAMAIEIHRYFCHTGTPPPSKRLRSLFAVTSQRKLADLVELAQNRGSEDIIKNLIRENVALCTKSLFVYVPKELTSKSKRFGIPTAKTVRENPKIFFGKEYQNLLLRFEFQERKEETKTDVKRPQANAFNFGKEGRKISLDESVIVKHFGKEKDRDSFVKPSLEDLQVSMAAVKIGDAIKMNEEDIAMPKIHGEIISKIPSLEEKSKEEESQITTRDTNRYEELEKKKPDRFMAFWGLSKNDRTFDRFASSRVGISISVRDLLNKGGLFLEGESAPEGQQNVRWISKMSRSSFQETLDKDGNPTFLEFAFPLGLKNNPNARGIPKGYFIKFSDATPNEKREKEIAIPKEEKDTTLDVSHEDVLSFWKRSYVSLRPSHWGLFARKEIQKALSTMGENDQALQKILSEVFSKRVPVFLHTKTTAQGRTLETNTFSGVNVNEFRDALKKITQNIRFDLDVAEKRFVVHYSLDIVPFPIALEWKDPEDPLGSNAGSQIFEAALLHEIVNSTQGVNVRDYEFLRQFINPKRVGETIDIDSKEMGILRSLFTDKEDALSDFCNFNVRSRTLSVSHPRFFGNSGHLVFFGYLSVLRMFLVRRENLESEEVFKPIVYAAVKNFINMHLDSVTWQQQTDKERFQKEMQILEEAWKISLIFGL